MGKNTQVTAITLGFIFWGSAAIISEDRQPDVFWILLVLGAVCGMVFLGNVLIAIYKKLF